MERLSYFVMLAQVAGIHVFFYHVEQEWMAGTVRP